MQPIRSSLPPGLRLQQLQRQWPRAGRHALPHQSLLPRRRRTQPSFPAEQSPNLGRPGSTMPRRALLPVRGQKRKTTARPNRRYNPTESVRLQFHGLQAAAPNRDDGER
uniref:Uncharacterized protein n=1 Tax=Rhizophora mucronata TaxID=61149 RepID=A0A2P2NT40_RHIMU